jgi:hypothetical protein
MFMGSLMNAFIVRPFGIRSGIDFDKVQTDLIQPALARFEIRGGTTGKILEAGNIREDMFQQLLVADLVIADVSLHNANVFYELGIRHALRPRRTYLLRARQEKPRQERGPEDEVPFDLRTDRYLEYDPKEPAATLSTFIDALNQTLLSDRQDSPVFRLLPDLQAQDRARFLPVPMKFREDVELASKKGQIGILGLLGLEAGEFSWASEALRLVGRAQAFVGARATWEAVSRLDPLDVEANLLLGTIYQRLLDLDASDQALQRAQLQQLGEESDFFFIEREEPESIQPTILELVKERIPGKLRLDPILDVQVLCPMNRGSLGARAMNVLLQNGLNPRRGDEPVVERFGWQFRLRDKVIQTENNYDKDVFNGDIGQVVSIDPEELELAIRFEERDVLYDFNELDELSLAYAITIHKSQGSEFPAVVVPLAMQHYLLLQRNLVYTAMTRGRRLVVLVGQRKALAMRAF